MPWKGHSERLQKRHTAGEETVAELCRRSGISRKTGEIDTRRMVTLDLSRASHSLEVAELIEAKRTHPTWGPRLTSPTARPPHHRAPTGPCGSSEAAQAAT